MTNIGDDTVLKLSQDGTIIATFQAGLTPRALAFDGETMWVANAGDSSVTRLTIDGEVLANFAVGGGFVSPSALLFDGEYMWLAASWGNTVTKLTLDGTVVRTIRIPGDHPAPTALAYDGEAVWVASVNIAGVQKVESDGGRLERFPVGRSNPDYGGPGSGTGGLGPASLAFDGENIWVATNWLHTVTKLNRDGDLLGEFQVGNWPVALAFDGESIWVADYWDNTATRLSLDGATLATVPVGRRPISIISAGDAIWVANIEGDTVTKILPAQPMAQPADGATMLTVALPSFGAETLDPSMDGQSGLQYHGHMFDHLLGATPDGRLSTELGALERWESSPDGKIYTLTLRKGMRWHDGAEVTSADIEFSMAHYSRDAATCAACPALQAALDRVEVVDRYTAKVHLKEPDVTFMHDLGPVRGDMPMLPQHHREDAGDGGVVSDPLGSGPWKFAERSRSEFIEYRANRDYWNPERVPGFDRLRLIQVPEAAVRVAMLRSGAVDMTILTLADVDPVKAEGFAIHGPKNVTATTLRFFMSYDPSFLTSSLEFRKALIQSMDVQSILEAVYPAEAATLPAGSTLFGPLSDGYDPDLPPYPYDPVGARTLLQESGYAGETVQLFSIAAYGLTEMFRINELIAEDWRQVGLDVRIIRTEFPQVLARYLTKPQRFEDVAPAPVFHGAFPTRPDVVSSIRRYMTSAQAGVMAYPDPQKGDRVYAEISALADPEARDRRLRELNRELYGEYWAADIVWRHDVYGLSPKIEGWQPTDGTSFDLHLETVRPVR